MEVGGPSLPSNYVTILHLKQRWLQQQQQQQQSSSKSQSTQHDIASQIPNEPLPNTKNHNQLKLDATVHDSDSKVPNEAVRHGRNRMVTDDSGYKTSNDAVRPSRNVNQFNPVEVVANDYGCKTADNHYAIVQKKQELNTDQSKLSAAKNASRGPNPRFVTEQILTDGGDTPEPVHEEKQKQKQKQKHKHKQKQHRYKDNHSIIEKQERDTDQSDSKLSTERNDFRGRNPRFVAEQIVTGGATQLLEPESEPVQEKKQKQKQHRYKGNYLTVENKEDESDQSNSKHSKKKNSSKSRNPRFLTDQIPGGDNTPGPEPVQEKKQNQKQHRYNDNYTIVEKHDNDTDQSISKRSTKKNSSGSRNPRLVTDRIPAGGSDQEPESVQEKKQNRYNDNFTIVENDTDQSNSKRSKKKNSYRSRNSRLVTDQIPAGDSTPEPETVQEKKQQRYNDNHIVVEHDTDQTNPQRSRKNNSTRSRNPRYVTDQIPNEDSTPEPVQEKKQNQKQNSYREERRSRNQEVWEPKVKLQEPESDVVVEAVAAAVKEIKINVTDVRQRSNGGRWGSRSYHGGWRTGPAKAPIRESKAQTANTVWVRKGEIAPN